MKLVLILIVSFFAEQKLQFLLQGENDENEENGTVMKRYLSGKFCPLTPSQQPTNVEHLVQNPNPNSEIVPASPTSALASSPMANYCSIM